MEEREARPAYVRFERQAVEDKPATRAEKRLIMKDVDFVKITPPYTRDVMVMKVESWIDLIRQQRDRGDIKPEWYDLYMKALETWRKGEEMPLLGTPVRGWGVISPAQQQNLIALGILTVEDLVAINEEGMRRIGMGSGELVSKAKAWLAQTNDKAPLTIKVSSLETEVARLTAVNQGLEEANKALMEQLATYERQAGMAARFEHLEVPEKATITAEDIFEDTPAVIPTRAPRKAQSAAPVA